MVERVYLALWVIYFITLAIFFVSGLLTATVVVAFGFVLFGMVFLGMIGILPHYATHNNRPLSH